MEAADMHTERRKCAPPSGTTLQRWDRHDVIMMMMNGVRWRAVSSHQLCSKFDYSLRLNNRGLHQPDSLLSRTPPSGMGGATAEAARDETNDWTEGSWRLH
eukprot:Tamp_24786.p1 GENE.Tamp_24786~~Tamp_24786.p1  ORF type:complete len:101 (+),score=4.23 Tamp_24786:181-483(+)